MKLKLLLTLNLLTAIRLFSQPTEEWVRRYNGPGNSFDIVTKLIPGNQNNLFVYGNSSGAGSLYDFAIINYDLNGNVRWTQTFNGEGNGADMLNSACIDYDNNSYVTGFTTDKNFKNNLTTAKYDSSGKLIWMKEFSGAAYANSYGQDIAQDTHGNVYVCGGLRYISTGKYSTIILKYSINGNLLSSIIYDSTGQTESLPVKVKINSNNNVVVSGFIKNSSDKNMYVCSFKNFPEISWTKTISGSSNDDDEITDMTIDNENNILICGVIRNNNALADYYFAKINSEGVMNWEGTYNGAWNNSDIPFSLKADITGNVYITGYSSSSSSAGSEDILTIKLSQSGNVIWDRYYNGTGNSTDQGITIALDNAGSIYIGGATDRGNGYLVYALLKYNHEGNMEWIKSYSVSNITEDFIYDIFADDDHNIYVTGISMGTGSNFDFATIKYSQSVGIKTDADIVPGKYVLNQNYPNPFNPVTVIRYLLIESGFVRLKVFDVLGKEIATLVNAKQNAGSYEVKFDIHFYGKSGDLSGGIYFYSIFLDGVNLETRNMLYLK